jgi:isopentenyldiphosphate isomerase
MVEHFETFNEAGDSLGLVPRSKVHREGLWHRASNVFLFRLNGEILIQRRQLSKDVWPGAWDLSAAEHLHPGESFEQGAIRGLREELGVVVSELEPFGEVTKSRLEVRVSDIKDFEFQQSFRATYGGSISPDVGEVMDTRWIEETGLRVQPSSVAAINSWAAPGSTPATHSIQILYFVEVLGGTLTNEVSGTTDLSAWHEISRVRDLPIVELVEVGLSLVAL